jgi:hypothetical protein
VNQAIPVLMVALLELYVATLSPTWLAWLPGWLGAATFLAGLAYVFNRPRWLGKSFTPLRWLLAPYLLFGQSIATLAQKAGHKERDEVVPGIWVGGFPRKGAPGLAQLDLTAELPRRGQALAYAVVPMLDGRGMTLEALDEAVRIGQAWRAAGHPVLVHCAYGHGRSCTVACALMVADGLAPDLDAAEALVKAHRPKAGMRPYQRRIADQWWAAQQNG